MQLGKLAVSLSECTNYLEGTYSVAIIFFFSILKLASFTAWSFFSLSISCQENKNMIKLQTIQGTHCPVALGTEMTQRNTGWRSDWLCNIQWSHMVSPLTVYECVALVNVKGTVKAVKR